MSVRCASVLPGRASLAQVLLVWEAGQYVNVTDTTRSGGCFWRFWPLATRDDPRWPHACRGRVGSLVRRAGDLCGLTFELTGPLWQAA